MTTKEKKETALSGGDQGGETSHFAFIVNPPGQGVKGISAQFQRCDEGAA